jgi:hypothetical protein
MSCFDLKMILKHGFIGSTCCFRIRIRLSRCEYLDCFPPFFVAIYSFASVLFFSFVSLLRSIIWIFLVVSFCAIIWIFHVMSFCAIIWIFRPKASFFHLFHLLVFSIFSIFCFGGGLARPQSVRAPARMCAHMILPACSTEIQSVWSVISTVPHVSKVLRMIADIGSHSRLFRPT